jgi:hypothetical protein
MKYRDARLLHEGDQVTRKTDDQVLTILSLEIYGSVKVVRFNVVNEHNVSTFVYNDEVK